MTTISSSSTIGIVLASPSYANPVVISPGVTITGEIGSGNGISAYSGTWTVTNAGSVAGTGTRGNGIYLYGGSVTNQSGGAITGFDAIEANSVASTIVNAGMLLGSTATTSGHVLRLNAGVELNAGGSVTNQTGGLIRGYLGIAAGTSAVTVENSAVIAGDMTHNYAAGVGLNAGGSITNQGTGTIEGYYAIYAYSNGNTTTTTVVNAGSLIGNTSGGEGVKLNAGGSVTNQSGGTISAARGIEGDGLLTVVNYGAIAGGLTLPKDGGVAFDAGGGVTNQSGAEISGYTGIYGSNGGVVTVVNYGSIAGNETPLNGKGVDLSVGGSVTNQSGGMISGRDGIYNRNTAITVVNEGSIAGSTTAGAGLAINYGSGIRLAAGGSVTNLSGGTISGDSGIYGLGAAVTVMNAGGIAGNASRGIGIALPAGSNVTNATSGSISGYYGILGAAGTVTIVNFGTVTGNTISSNGSAGGGVNLAFGGTVTNQSSALISGYLSGILGLNSAGAGGGVSTVVNYGSIAATASTATGVFFLVGGSVTNTTSAAITGGYNAIFITGDAGAVLNAGQIDAVHNAVVLDAGGNIINQADGTINSSENNAVHIAGGAGTVFNAGVIMPTGGTHAAVSLLHGGAVTNSGTGTIGGTANTGVYISGGTGTVINTSSIVTGVRGVDMRAGGYVSNAGTGTIHGSTGVGVYITGGAGAVINAGSIASQGASGSGVALGGGGSVTNATLASVTGYLAVNIDGGTGNVINNGSIGGTGTRGAGVRLRAGGSVTNSASALIIGGQNGVHISGGIGTVVNGGSIASFVGATASHGVQLDSGGLVTNASSGTITGGTRGVYAQGGSSTVINAGAIIGTGDTDAVLFGAGFANRLVTDPGALFNGTVDGGNLIGAASISTLELASGASAGTLSGLGTQFINFEQATIDANAAWTFTSANTLVAGATLTNAGTLVLSNGILNGAGSVINNGTIVVDPSSLTLAALSGTGEVVVGSGSTVTTQGTVTAGETFAFAGGDGDLNIAFSTFSGTIEGFDATDTIDLPGVTDAISAGIVNGNTLQIEQTGGPTISLTLDPNQNYTGGLFAVGANGALTSDLGRILSWTGDGGTSFGTPANWDDITDSLNPAQAAPNATDTVEFNTSDGGVTGTGTVATLDVGAGGTGALQLSNGATIVAGSLDAGIGAADVAQLGVTGAGTDLSVTGSASLADDGTGVMSVLSGATFSAASLTIGAQGDSSGALVVSGDGSVVTISGDLNVGTALGTGDLTIGPGATVNASVVNLQGAVVLENGLLDPTVNLINQGQTAGGSGTIAAGDIVDEGVIQAGGSKPSQKLLVVAGTILGGGPWTINGTAQPQANGDVGVLEINAGGTLELTGPVLNAASTTFTDDVTPQSTYTVNDSVVDVNFGDTTGVLKLDDIAGFAGTIAAFRKGDSFVITGGTLSNLGVTGGSTLTVSDSGNDGTDQLIFGSPISAAGFTIVNTNTIQVACFAAGTRIDTGTGLIAVEDLSVGNRVKTDDGAREPIVWLGQRTVNCRAHPKPETVWPVRVSAGAFGQNVPVRDLYLSPDHAVFINGVLVPAKLLLNGTTIAQTKRNHITYYHIELPHHALILAEGLTVESYLDLGDRADFHHDTGVMRLFPDFAATPPPAATMAWEAKAVAPLTITGDALDAARAAVAANAPSPWSTPRTA